jgi:hypothetical protein
MKRVTFILLPVVFLLFSTSAFSQLNLSLGPNAGVGHAWMKGGDGDNRYKPAGNFGVALVYSANEHIGIGADLKYSIEGVKRDIGNNSVTYRLNYLRVPLKGIYFFRNHGDKIRPKVSLGPSFGFLLGGNQEVNDDETSLEVKDQFKSMDIGLALSGGIHARLVTNTWLTLDLNYYHGFTGVAENASAFPDNLKNRNIGINLGLLFGIARAEED